jgi:hypothetical protein
MSHDPILDARTNEPQKQAQRSQIYMADIEGL